MCLLTDTYSECVSSIFGIYQQGITKLKELDREARREREEEGGKKLKTTLHRYSFKLTAHRFF